jgi:hypothetical protein
MGQTRRRGFVSCATCAAPRSGLPPQPSSPNAPAVFAVFTGNYQRATSPSVQKSWSSGSPAEEGTARRPAVKPCKFAKRRSRGCQDACDEPTVCYHLRITIFPAISGISQFVKDRMTYCRSNQPREVRGGARWGREWPGEPRRRSTERGVRRAIGNEGLLRRKVANEARTWPSSFALFVFLSLLGAAWSVVAILLAGLGRVRRP